MIQRLLLLAGLLAALVTLPRFVEGQGTAYTPAATTVAVVPVVNITKSKHPDKDAELQAKQAGEGSRALAEAFKKHAFQLTDPALVTAAMQANHFDATNQADWTADSLAGIGKAVHANLVVLMVITDTHQGFRHGFLVMGAQREGEAKTKLWLVDTQAQTAVIDGVAAAGKAQASALQGWALGGIGEGSSAYVLKAVDDAVNKSLTGFFKSYPAAK